MNQFQHKAAAILTGPFTHLDHLGVLSHLLNIPLIVPDEEVSIKAKTYYPFFNVIHRDWSELTLDYFAANYDLLFESGKFLAFEMKSLLELFFQKKMGFVFCPHGNSDKGRSLKTDDFHPNQDISLVYGQQMIDLLTNNGAINKIESVIRTGNYRLTFYRQYQEFYDQIAEKEIFSKLTKGNRNLFYAPTWQDTENRSSFFTACEVLLNNLPPEFNLILKWHPFLIRDAYARVVSFEKRFENASNIVFASDFPSIYPILARSDAYIGDHSSIGYDFLAFDRPLFFLTNGEEKQSTLGQTGIQLSETDPKIYQTIDFYLKNKNQLLSEKRKKTYDYAFGSERSFLDIKNELEKTISLHKDNEIVLEDFK